jgi:DNA-binding response OmpR family regulator
MPSGQLVVLAVDDVPEMREMLRLILSGIPEVKAVIAAGNVWEARLELTRRRPALVILDEVLPGESSLDFLEELRKEGIPVVLVTGVTDRKAPLPDGASARVFKPDGRHPTADAKRFREAIQKVFPGL